MKNFICLFLILAAAALTAFGQKTYEVRDFSKDYYGKVYLEKPSESYSPGWIGIFEKKTNRQIIKLAAEELDGGALEAKVKSNVSELPYGEQYLIIHDDFNFDGTKDFAIKDGQNGCYGEASFRIYLAGRAKAKFALSKSFTRLAQDYCGMFEADAKEKKIRTTLKSGAGSHQFSEFIVVRNALKAVKIVEEKWDFPFNTVSTETWNGRKMVKKVSRKVAFQDGDVKILLSFKTVDFGAEVVLYSYNDELNYIFINKSGDVRFAYPLDSAHENPRFTLDSKENGTRLSFTHLNQTTSVYETGTDKIGVDTETNGRLIADLPGVLTSRKGSLRQLASEKLTNVIFK